MLHDDDACGVRSGLGRSSEKRAEAGGWRSRLGRITKKTYFVARVTASLARLVVRAIRAPEETRRLKHARGVGIGALYS